MLADAFARRSSVPAADDESAPRKFMPIARTTRRTISSGRCASGASKPLSPNETRSMAADWVNIVVSWKATSLEYSSSDACEYATKSERTFTPRSSPWGFVRVPKAKWSRGSGWHVPEPPAKGVAAARHVTNQRPSLESLGCYTRPRYRTIGAGKIVRTFEATCGGSGTSTPGVTWAASALATQSGQRSSTTHLKLGTFFVVTPRISLCFV
jgi:hypothetical protein